MCLFENVCKRSVKNANSLKSIHLKTKSGSNKKHWKEKKCQRFTNLIGNFRGIRLHLLRDFSSLSKSYLKEETMWYIHNQNVAKLMHWIISYHWIFSLSINKNWLGIYFFFLTFQAITLPVKLDPNGNQGTLLCYFAWSDCP